jgi:hypothetical protein
VRAAAFRGLSRADNFRAGASGEGGSPFSLVRLFRSVGTSAGPCGPLGSAPLTPDIPELFQDTRPRRGILFVGRGRAALPRLHERLGAVQLRPRPPGHPPGAGRGHPEGTARFAVSRPEPATCSSPSFLMSSAKRGSEVGCRGRSFQRRANEGAGTNTLPQSF